MHSMNTSRFVSQPILVLLLMVLSVTGLFSLQPVEAAAASEAEIEQYVNARIELGEAMGSFFKTRKPPQFGPDGGPSMDELRKLEAEINAFVADVLLKHNLTIDQYQTNSPEVFSDEAGIDMFLDGNPELKKRYEVLPKAPKRGRGH